MKVGLIDVDMIHRGKMTFPNLPLMKLSAWHKKQGDLVEWYDTPLISGHVDLCYVSKVFSDTYTPDIDFQPDADVIIKGGSGYAITTVDGIERYDKAKDQPLPDEVEHIYPDYGLYGITDTAYGFLTRGCPRGCNFCHVAGMQGRKSHTVSTLDEFWHGQKNIVLLDPNIGACREWEQHFQTLIDSKAYVDFSQGIDIRLMTPEKWEMLSKIKTKMIHFAWDNPEDDMIPRFQDANGRIKLNRWKHSVYILTNFNSTFEQDVYRVETVKRYGMQPYVMIYNKYAASNELKKLARYANNPFVCWATKTYGDYVSNTRSERFGNTGIKHKSSKDFDFIHNGYMEGDKK